VKPADGPKISVIIPAYNAANTVGRAIESALAQTYAPTDIVVVDDGSTDATAEVAGHYPKPVIVVRQPNGGTGAARNHAARLASGDWLGFLDADDTWLPQRLERQLPFTADPNVGLVHGRHPNAPGPKAPPLVDFETLWRLNCIMLSTALVRRQALEAVGGFSEEPDLIGCEDYHLWLRLAAADWKISTCPERLCDYTPATGSLSSQVERFARSELANARAIGKALNLDPLKVRYKEAEICARYGRELLHERRARPARALLAESIRVRPLPSPLAWWLLTFTPTWLLEWRRRVVGTAPSR
jgi:glycosyltransferase involved in cell wall biosynthesis